MRNDVLLFGICLEVRNCSSIEVKCCRKVVAAKRTLNSKSKWGTKEKVHGIFQTNDKLIDFLLLHTFCSLLCIDVAKMLI